jgi:hypothetical protein
MHVGLHADYCEVLWDEQYRVPRDVAADVCDYPLARNLVLLSVVVAFEAVIACFASGERASRFATLGDLAIRPLEGST